MKQNKALLSTFLLLIASAALYRVIPGRPYGFAPQIAMALFGGAIFRDLKWSFALPLFSMFISDVLYEILFQAGITPIQGFYSGQWLNYMELASVVFIGIFLRSFSWSRFLISGIIAPTWFFIISNFTVWAGGSGLLIPKNFIGLMETYILGLPFYAYSIAATYLFGALFFGVWLYGLKGKNVSAVSHS
jgi:hypothetical protein